MAAALPELPYLEQALSELITAADRDGAGLSIEHRRPNMHASTFASEIITCRLGDGRSIELLCKHADGEAPGHGAAAAAHRSGLVYEGMVYQHVLRPRGYARPCCYGMHRDAASGRWTLVLEYLHSAMTACRMVHRVPLSAAAEWIGRFHSLNDHDAASIARCAAFVRRHDAAYYRQWARRAASLARPLAGRYPWFNDLCQAFCDRMADTLACQPTLVHGEYYPNNILVHEGGIHPVDWESAAVGAAELDLAALIECWPEDDMLACRASYVAARWAGRPPGAFAPRLDAAGLFLHLRWLGERRQWTLRPGARWRFAAAKELGGRLGLI